MTVIVLGGALIVAFVGSALGIILFGAVLVAQVFDSGSSFGLVGTTIRRALPRRLRARLAIAEDAQSTAHERLEPSFNRVTVFARRGLAVSVLIFLASFAIAWLGNTLGWLS